MAEHDNRLLALFTADNAAPSEAAPSSQDTSVGSIVEATVHEVKEFQINVRIGKVPGRIHITEITDNTADAAPLSRFSKGDTLRVKVCSWETMRSIKILYHTF